MTTRVSRVETSTPNSSDTAMPWKIGSESSTIEPMTRANAVIMIGRRRTWAASVIAVFQDTLQAVIALLKGSDLDVALQFVNYR